MWVLACNQKCNSCIGNFNEWKKLKVHCCINNHKVWVYSQETKIEIYIKGCVYKSFILVFWMVGGGENYNIIYFPQQ